MSKPLVVRRNIGGARNANRSEKTKSTHIMDNVIGCTDMVLLDPLDEDSVIKNIKARFNAGEIYTYIGNVVISINPCRQLEIYSPGYIAKYRSRNMFELPPHVYALADEAYRSMRDRNIDQCIIISGESGSGKTEASKLIMQYVAQVSGKGEEVDVVKQQLLQSNPVLEAFGNAKTKRNNNSSRFGKYMDIEFDYKGDPVGGVISTYLLEKSRVVDTNPGEANFHIFFKLLAGTDPDFLEMLHLENNPAKYKYLLTSDGKLPIGMESNPVLDSTIKAMEIIGFSSEDMISVFELLAAILNLGNIEFEGYLTPDETKASKLINAEAAHYACDMLGCSYELLEQCLTKRIVETSRDVVVTHLSAIEASFARDGLSKAIYSRMFKWLVERINEKIEPTKRGKRKCMGVLDIYGFEVFEKNRFEQFMINYCNERLQQLFLELTLCTEQDEYVREGIEWVKIEYFDNEVICKMIENPRTGIIAVLNEECLRPGTKNDKTFLDRLNQIYHNHDHYISRASEGYQSDTSIELEEFQLVHYAGTVTYNTVGFMDKNHDQLYKDLSQAMYACERPFLKLLFKEGNPEAENLKRPLTTGQNFKASVAEMMRNLQSKNPHYVRCIKPNDDKQPRKFEGYIVRSQVRYMNMLENIKVQRTGYAFRQSYEEALGRYKMLSSRTWPVWKKRPKDGVKAIMEDCGYKRDDAYSFGRTKIFIRTPKTVFEMEEKRSKKMEELSTVITKIVRGWLAKRKYQKLRNSQITIAKYYHGSKCRKEYLKLRMAAIVFQKYIRGWKVRNEARNAKYIISATKAANCIRRCYFRWKLSKTINERIQLKVAIPAAIVIQKYYRGWKVRKQLQGKSTEDAAPIIINFIRRALCYRFLVTLLYNLPSASPIDKKWPKCSPMFKSTSILLRNLYHRWRCQLVVKYYTSNLREKRKLSEKLKASTLFKRRKALYPSSVPNPFVSDRLNIQSDGRWSKVVGGDRKEMRIIWADNVRKLNRSDAKLTNRSLAITTTALYILDTKNYGLQHKISLRDVIGISLSPHNDHFFVLHLDLSHSSHDKLHPKGDVVLENPNVIECVTKLAMIFIETQKRELQLQFKTDIGIQLKAGDNTVLRFLQAKPGGSSSPACKKKGNLVTIAVD